MPQSPKKPAKTRKLYGRPANAPGGNGEATIRRPSGKKPNYTRIIDDLVSQFSEEFCHGKIPDTTTYLKRLKAPYRVKKDLHELLLSTKLAYLVYHPKIAKQSKESISQIEAKLKKLYRK